MTEDHSPGAGETTGVGTPEGHDQSVYKSRRRLLETITIGGSVALAGCNLLRSDPENNSDGKSPTSGQTFRAPVGQNPAQASFYAPFADLKKTFAVTAKKQVSGRLQRSVREPGVWADKRYIGGELHYTWLKDITSTPTEITVTIRDDARWSDGHPITGRDIAAPLMAQYIGNRFPPYFATEEKDEPTIVRDAIDMFEITDKSVTYRSSPGYFANLWNSILAGFVPGNKLVPTHIEPYDAYVEAVFETAHRAQEGEINPWKGWNNPRILPDDPHRASLVEKYLANEGTYVAKFSHPEHVVSTSVWDVVELSGPEAVFERNPHHRNADAINFDRVILGYTASEERERTTLKADRLDYAAPGPMTQSVVESLPDTITQLQIPGGPGTGNELGLSFNHPALGNRNVRLALMYALDQSTIANNIHQTTADPVTTPGGDSWNAADYVSEGWIDENLTTYPQDHAKAASLMQAAGYTKDNGQWVTANGETLTLSLPTPSGTPRWEPTVANQLTEFGIHTSVQTLEETTFETRHVNGEFSMWAASGVASSTAANTLKFWFGVPAHPKVYGIYPKEQYGNGNFSDQGRPVPLTQQRYDVFTIKAPPIGHPEGPLQEYTPSSLALAFLSQPPETEFRRRVKTGLWLVNWFLPTIPINKTVTQHFIDDAHWQWPTDTPSWQNFTNSGPRSIDGIVASGSIRANPDNPEEVETK